MRLFQPPLLFGKTSTNSLPIHAHEQRTNPPPLGRPIRCQSRGLDDFITDALHVLEDWFSAATEPLLATFDERHPKDKWLGVILADDRASEAYQADEQP